MTVVQFCEYTKKKNHCIVCVERVNFGDFPGSPVVKASHFHCRGHLVRSLVGELRSHMPHDATKKFFLIFLAALHGM